MPTKAELLRQELVVAEAEEALVKAKAKRERCDECGRLKPATAKDEKRIAAAKAIVREVRRQHREARGAAGVVVT